MTYRILGLDISSSCIGYALLTIEDDNAIYLEYCNHYKPPKDGDVFTRLAKTRKDMKRIIKQLVPTEIAIEDIIQFMGKGSSAQTIIALAQVNRTVGLVAYDYLKRSPTLHNVLTIRHGIKLGKDLPSKEEIPELVAKRLKVEFPYVFNKKDKHAPESNDRADAIAVALYRALEITNQLPKKGKQPK
jgi:Holliday junction resolvasome RuvABC endonuclease subunit